MTEAERQAMLRGAAYMREKIAQALESSPRKPIHEAGAHVRTNIRLPEDGSVERVQDQWLDADIAAELATKGERTHA